MPFLRIHVNSFNVASYTIHKLVYLRFAKVMKTVVMRGSCANVCGPRRRRGGHVIRFSTELLAPAPTRISVKASLAGSGGAAHWPLA